MKIIFTKHAEIKLAHRRITRDKVRLVLSSPEFVRPSHGGRQVAYRKIVKNYLAVVFMKEKDGFVVITQYWLAKTKI